VSLVAGLWLTRRGARTDRERAGWILFGTWALVHVGIFSTQQGIFHPYYVSALAPAVAALCGAGVVSMWRWARISWAGVVALDVGIVYTALLAVRLLARTPDFVPVLRTVIPIAAGVAILGSLALRMPGLVGRRGIAVAAVAGALALTAAPAAYSVANLGRSLNGNNVIAGPASAAAGGFGGGMGTSSALISYLEAHQGSAKYLVAATGSQTTAAMIIATGKPVVTIGGFSGNDNAPTVAQLAAMVKAGELRYVLIGGGGGMGRGGSSELSAWVQAHGTAVEGVTTSGTLYAVSAS
jgi:4-amino-4-deoxy-L-arabinose transferase-like glycosyltransferase